MLTHYIADLICCMHLRVLSVAPGQLRGDALRQTDLPEGGELRFKHHQVRIEVVKIGQAAG